MDFTESIGIVLLPFTDIAAIRIKLLTYTNFGQCNRNFNTFLAPLVGS